jgi:hypothetical protein
MDMMTVVELTDDNRPEYEKVLGILIGYTHIIRGMWPAINGSNAQPKGGWTDPEFTEFEKTVKEHGATRKLVMSGRELSILVDGEGPLNPRGPMICRGYGFAAINRQDLQKTG